MQQTETLDAEYQRLGRYEEYLKLKQQCESLVVQWRWAKDHMLQLEPFYTQKHQFPEGRWLKDRPKSGNAVEHGLDEQDRIVLMRQSHQFPTGVRCDEVFVERSDNLVQQARYQGAFGGRQPQLIGVERLHGQSPSPARFERMAVAGKQISEYEHEGPRVILERQRHQPQPIAAGRFSLRQFRYSFDNLNRLERIERLALDASTANPAGEWETVFRAPAGGETIESLSALIEQGLVEEIPRVLRTARIEDSVYSLLLVYDSLNPPLPPVLALGKDSDRQALIERHGKSVKEHLWTPDEYAYFGGPSLELKNPVLVEACRQMNQMMALQDQNSSGRELLEDVAAQLMGRRWKGILQTTEDFVVAAIDLSGCDDFLKNMKKSVPSQLISQLRKNHFI